MKLSAISYQQSANCFKNILLNADGLNPKIYIFG